MPLVTANGMASPGWPTVSPWRTLLAARKAQVRKSIAFDLYQSNVTIGVDVNDVGRKLLASRQDRQQGAFATGKMRVRGDYAFFGDEEAAARFAQTPRRWRLPSMELLS